MDIVSIRVDSLAQCIDLVFAALSREVALAGSAIPYILCEEALSESQSECPDDFNLTEIMAPTRRAREAVSRRLALTQDAEGSTIVQKLQSMRTSLLAEDSTFHLELSFFFGASG